MDIFNDILKSSQESQGRVHGITYGVVSSIDDPLTLGRIQCLDASKGGKSATDWLFRVLPFPGFSPPLPQLGDTILVGYIDGDPHNGVYFGSLQNTRNPVINTGDDLVIKVGVVTVKIKPSGVVSLDGVTELNISSPVVKFSNAQSITINNKEVLTLGSVDTAGKTNVSKGW